ncbi:hypothetical protein [Arsenophonus sp. ENCA]|uniref:hypothetical protein n=1 Tax=Arsenophonus sp. ENCA TaxID=1987579 RepID=UPI0025C02ECF|nr:hypothetical protein [Arsenophonus sp. ENCA]
MYNKILVPIDIVEDELNQKVIKHVETLVSFNQPSKPEIHFLSVLPDLEIFFGIEIAALPGPFPVETQQTHKTLCSH